MHATERLPRGRYFEEFEIGQRVITPGRTITESDIVAFAGLTGDYNQIHTDAAYAQDHMFGKRVAHGLLGLSIAVGLAFRTGMIEGTVLAFREIGEWKFSLPVFIGDTVHVEMEVLSTREMSRLGGGAVDLDAKVNNQDNKTVQKGVWRLLVQSRPPDG